MHKSSKKVVKNKNNKVKYNFKKPNSKIIIFYSILIVLIILLSFFYFNAIKKMPSNFTLIHYYDYYTTSVVLAEKIVHFDIPGFYHLFVYSYPNKLTAITKIPFFIIFKPTTFVFNFSNYFINTILLIFLFKTLLRIEKPFRAFTLTLLIFGSKFFLEMLLSGYIDLGYMLIFSIFLIYLYEFDKDYKKNNISLAFLVFLLFFTKNVSYLLIPILLMSLTFYYLFYKKERKEYLKRIWLIFVIGFSISFIISTGLMRNWLMSPFEQSGERWIETGNLFSVIESFIKFILNRFREGVFKSWLFLFKFKSLTVSIVLYLILAYNILKKRNLFWVLMFIFSDLFLFFFYNIRDIGFEFRHVTIFYLIYFYLFYDFMYVACKRLFNKYSNYILLFIISLLFLFNFLQISNNMQNPNDYIPTYFILIPELVINVEQGSKVYIDRKYSNDPLYHNYVSEFTRDNNLNLTRLTSIDPRFAYTITEDIETADYILTTRIQNFNLSCYNIIDHLPPLKHDPRELHLIKEKESCS
jgi:hypothetical protein